MYIFIVNPMAGSGRAKAIFSKIRKTDLYQELQSMVFYSKHPGHAEEFVSSLLIEQSDIQCIIVIGGDGTMHEVLNGLPSDKVPVAFIPGGSGNDFARGCKMKGNPIDLFDRIIRNPEYFAYWLGNYETDEKTERNFINSFGFGFDACIAHMANNAKYKKIFNLFHLATLSYAVALIHVLFRFKPMDIELAIDNEKRLIRNCWMITAANHPFYGGGMKIIPNAQIQPDTFPVLILHSISKLKVLALFLTVFSGKHINFKEVEILNASYLKITANKPVYYQVDGQTSSCLACSLSKQSKPISVVRPGL